MKSYNQRCPLARALDRVGDRWTLLVVRELMLGPRRYTDLQDGLPGVGTNVLAARLSQLQEAQLVSQRTLPPPTAVTVYELTDAGAALSASVRALSEWGEQYGAPATDSQAVKPAWVLLGVARRGSDLESGRACELRVGREVFELAAADGQLSVTAGSAHAPDAVVTITPELFYGLASSRITAAKARARIEIEGSPAVADSVLAAISGAVPST